MRRKTMFADRRSQEIPAADERLPAARSMTRYRALAPVAAVALLSLAGCPRPRPVAPAPPNALAAAGMSPALPAELDSIMSGAIADHASPGITIAIGHHGRIVYTHGWGHTDWAAGAPAANDSTIYD